MTRNSSGKVLPGDPRDLKPGPRALRSVAWRSMLRDHRMLVRGCHIMILESPAIPTNKICAKYVHIHTCMHTYSLANAITAHRPAPTP